MLERRAATTLNGVDTESVIDRRPLLWASYVLLAVVVSTCAYVVLSPKRVMPSFLRAVLPTSDRVVATRTEILEVKPGDVTVLSGGRVDLEVRLRGELPPAVTAFLSTADQRLLDAPVTLRPHDEVPGLFHGEIIGDPGRGIVQDLTYRVVAGDTEAGPFTVTVERPPSVALEAVTLIPPAYTTLSERVVAPPAIDGVQGTRLRLEGKSDRPLRSAELVIAEDPNFLTEVFEIPLRLGKDNAVAGDWVLDVPLGEDRQPRPFDGLLPHHLPRPGGAKRTRRRRPTPSPSGRT